MKPIEHLYRKKKRKPMTAADAQALAQRVGRQPAGAAEEALPGQLLASSGTEGSGAKSVRAAARGTFRGREEFRGRTDWGEVSDWYDTLVGDFGSEYHREVVLPGVLRLAAVGPADKAVDIACGQGVLCRLMHQKGAKVVGVDAAATLIAAAIDRSDPAIDYRVADARDLSSLPAEQFTIATCVLAIQNIDPLGPVCEGVARLLTPGGRFILVMMHPAFRQPKQAHWGWDAATRVQYRRVDRYMLAYKESIAVHPGANPNQQVWAFHRPLQSYVNALGAAGLLIDRLEEWCSHKKSDAGPKAAAEDKARKEIPLFLALRAIKPRR